jgi:hypothetical protein
MASAGRVKKAMSWCQGFSAADQGRLERGLVLEHDRGLAHDPGDGVDERRVLRDRGEARLVLGEVDQLADDVLLLVAGEGRQELDGLGLELDAGLVGDLTVDELGRWPSIRSRRPSRAAATMSGGKASSMTR